MFSEKSSAKVSVRDFFDNPINNQSAVKCLVGQPKINSFGTNLNEYLTEKAITDMIEINAEVKNILNKFKIPLKINIKVLRNLMHNHLAQTREIAVGVVFNLPQQYKPQINQKALAEATFLHDIAKALIPENIVNKQGSLNEYEREIMKQHATLSYELLKGTGLSQKTLELIKNHHNPISIEEQVLSIADIYSALREHRSYKKEMTKEQALHVIKKETEKGKFHQSVYQALVEYVDKNENEPETHNQNKKFQLDMINCFSL